MNINVEKVEEGYRVYFPYNEELISTLKDLIKTAKFDRSLRCWIVGPRSAKRLEQWKEIAQPLIDDMAALEAQEATIKEIESVRSKIDKARSIIAERYSKNEKRDVLIKEFESEKDKLEELKKKLTKPL